jgi:hypothetical protein
VADRRRGALLMVAILNVLLVLLALVVLREAERILRLR